MGRQEVFSFAENKKKPLKSYDFKGLVETAGLEPVTSCV